MKLRDFNNFWTGLMIGLILYSLLLASQYGFSFTIIRGGFWSIINCLKPQTLIIFPAMGLVYYAMLGKCKQRIFKTIALIFLCFILQDTAFMFFYSPIYSTDALARNIFLMYFSLYFLVKSGKEIHLDRLLLFSLLSLAILYVYSKTILNADMASPDYIWNDSTLKLIPSITIFLSFKKEKEGERVS